MTVTLDSEEKSVNPLVRKGIEEREREEGSSNLTTPQTEQLSL